MTPVPTPEPKAPSAPSDLQRIMTIGDSVFAVALTLLAAGVRLPPELVGKKLLIADLRPMMLDMGAVALSFCVASLFWVGHWLYLRRAIRTTVPFLISNLAVLLCIVLLPISTRLLSAGPISTASAAVYSANLLATSIAEFLFRRQAVAMSVPIGQAIEGPDPSRRPIALLGAAFHACALIAAFVDPFFAVSLWIGALSVPAFEAWRNRSRPGVKVSV